ncbi:porphobilinogen synthase [Akkermansia sp. N21169]|uniref:porphobilinogen synthase n=1 Tax=unclassified Akkermansia TaxID=2608915 RepID=UPI00244E86E7|nr:MULTISPECIES: porphobilinogen synthase [unclassified Akkermansia]MDH3068455.1 porphobilinogen synthase [Akkermansia sp. N21169]WPX39775.1 porphobilinogen synthase [Akkermansia sp. N21116]
MFNLPIRPRRNRKSAAIRDLVAETHLSPSQFILPVFIHESDEDVPIESLPGCTRWSIPGLVEEAKRLMDLGITSVDIFPAVPDSKKTPGAEEAYNPDGLVPRAIVALKDALPDLVVNTDVALDPYNTDGHDGIVQFYPDGSYEILNDPTIEVLCRQALCFAEAGADVISPSDMMDGRVAAIRSALDYEHLEDVSIMAYTAKYASAMYGPFRGALESAPKSGDKKTYQMDPRNLREALREAALDEAEGADILMVKPATMYLDVLHAMRQTTTLPLAAYHVSGEYLMLKAAAASGWIDEQAAVLETLTSIRRAGADMILTYYAAQAAAWLQGRSL